MTIYELRENPQKLKKLGKEICCLRELYSQGISI